ncbi:MAG: DNA polymerase III subunit delta [Gammaproteobacteria bacterium]|nr:DNA polymerase III subunit delta [Gammaproteobacteria bacterium]
MRFQLLPLPTVALNLRPQQFLNALETEALPRAILFHGDEPLQIRECLDALRECASKQGLAERCILHGDAKFDWRELDASTDSLSLFAERRLFEVHLSARPGAKGAETLLRHVQGSGDDVIAVLSPRLDASAQRTAWFKKLQEVLPCVGFYDVAIGELPRWLQERCRRLGLEPSRAACELLAERTEGNLLAAAQEVDKLVLLCGRGVVDTDDVLFAGGDSARYSAFDLVDAALSGEGARALRILRALRGEGMEIPPLLGSVTWMLRSLCRLAEYERSGRAVDAALRGAEFAALRRRRAAVQRAMHRSGPAQLYGILRQAKRIDEVYKGRSPGDPWLLLERACLALAGHSEFNR